MIEIKPLKPIMTEEELDVEFDEEDVRIFDSEVNFSYVVSFVGYNKLKEENGYYFSKEFPSSDLAYRYAYSITKNDLSNLPKTTYLISVEIIKTANGDDIEQIAELEII